MSAAVMYERNPTYRRRSQYRHLGVHVHANGVATIDTKHARQTVTPGDWIVTDGDGHRRVYSPEAFARARRMNLDT